MQDRTKGLVYTFVGTLAFTPDTLLVRLIDTDPITMISIRGLLMSVSITLCLFLFFRPHIKGYLRQFRVFDLIFAIIFAVTMFFFVFALSTTSVANVLVFISTAPVFAALIAHFALNERLGIQTSAAIAVSMFGIGVVAWGEARHDVVTNASAFSWEPLVGCFCALATAVLIGTNMVVRKKSVMDNSMPALVLGGLFSGLAALPFANYLSLDGGQFGYSLLLGLIVMPIACTCTFIGPRYLPAAEVSMISLLEVVIAPVWIWLVISEVPSSTTIYGGVIVIASVLLYTTLVTKENRPEVFAAREA